MSTFSEYDIRRQIERDFREILPSGIDIIGEYRIRGSQRVDFVIARGFEILACIEVKFDLSNDEIKAHAQEQVRFYQAELKSYWAIITDSKKYYIHSLADEEDEFVEKTCAENVLQVILGLQTGAKNHKRKAGEEIQIVHLKNSFKELCDKYEKIKTIKSVKDVLSHISSDNCRVTATRYTFTRTFENRLFQALLGAYNEDEVVRFVPFASIHRSLNEQTIGMVSLIGMNDVSECYYADQYVAKKKGEFKGDESILPAENTLLNNTYILSCNALSMRDNLTMWRLYGDKCKGACIRMVIDKDMLENDNSFILAPVSYGESNDNHPALDFANDIISLKVDNKNLTFETWCYWKHFFKDYRYSVENEVRLLYTGMGCGKRSWILASENEIPCTISIFPIKTLPNHSNDFPLTLSEVIIGSKCTDKDTKRRQFEELIKERNRGYDKGFARVNPSDIDNYR